MSFEQNLRRIVIQYLDGQNAERRFLRGVLDRIEQALPDTVIFGGMLREFALGNARTFTSDIDLVTSASAYEIGKAVASYMPMKNKFGGYRFTAGRWRFDLWSLQDTWAFQMGHVKPATFGSLLKTSFFNLDAAHFHLSSRQVSLHPGYEGWIRERLLDINLETNPNPQNMVRRALDLVIENQLSVGNRLQRFLAKHAEDTEKALSWPEAMILGGVANSFAQGGGVFKFQPQAGLLSS